MCRYWSYIQKGQLKWSGFALTRYNSFSDIRMKKIVICGLLAAGCCLSAAAYSNKLSPQAKLMLGERTMAAKTRSAVTVPETISAIVRLNDGEDVSVLREKGLDVRTTIGKFHIVSLPLDRAEEIAAMPEVFSMSFGEKSGVRMDVARRLSFSDQVNQGFEFKGQQMSFTGRGVVTGLYDMGLDPNHAAFRNADGSTRVKAVYLSKEQTGVTAYTTPEAIAGFQTDAVGETHGTHVAGIMAGSRNVQGKYAQANGSQVVRTEGDIPYYGVAYNSDLVIGCGDFYDSQIMEGVERVVAYARQSGQPAVVNLSLGNNSGSHDPNSETSQILDELSKDAVICVAAGNEGEQPMAIQKNFSRMAGTTLNTFMSGATNDSWKLRYTAEFWSGTSETFDCELVIYDKLDQKVVSSKPATDGAFYSASNWPEFGEVYDAASSIRVASGVDKNTNRFYVLMSNTTQYKNGSSTKMLGVNIKGKSGEKCFAYINAGYNPEQEVVFSSQNVQGYIAGSPDGSINGFGCGKKILSVGSYTSRTSAPLLGNGNYTGRGTVGAISSFSSYGEVDGDQLPMICAPGQQIVSSISQYWYENLKMTENDINALSTSFDHTSPYYPMQGTSMATPFAAGVVALMLEARPDLSSEDIIWILRRKENATTDAQTNGVDFKRWGAGKINALKAVKAAIEHDAIGETFVDNLDRNFMVEYTGAKQYNIVVPGASVMNVTVYNLQGAAVLNATASGSTTALNASALASGIYVLVADTDLGKVTRKMVLN